MDIKAFRCDICNAIQEITKKDPRYQMTINAIKYDSYDMAYRTNQSNKSDLCDSCHAALQQALKVFKEEGTEQFRTYMGLKSE